MDIITASTISDIEVCRKVGKSNIVIAEDSLFSVRYRRSIKAGVEYIHLLATHKPTGDTRTLLIWDYPTFGRQSPNVMAISLNDRLETINNVIKKNRTI